MSNHVIHISKAEAASNFASLLDRVCAGTEVIIEDRSRAVAVLRSAPLRPGRLLSESIAMAFAILSSVSRWTGTLFALFFDL